MKVPKSAGQGRSSAVTRPWSSFAVKLQAPRLSDKLPDSAHVSADHAQCGHAFLVSFRQDDMDDREAARLYKLAADQGDARAQVGLGFFYAMGRGGLPKDDREAARLFKVAADQGDAGGQDNLGICYLTGRGGLPKDEREAARLFKLAADQGNAQAQANLGTFYRDGRGGLPKDEREADRLFKLAADQGNTDVRTRQI